MRQCLLLLSACMFVLAVSSNRSPVQPSPVKAHESSASTCTRNNNPRRCSTPTSQPSLTRTPTLIPTPTVTRTPTPIPPGSDPILVGAGDIASCSSSGDEATAKLLAGIAGTVITLGDNAYDAGTTTEYTNCYHPTWGQQKLRTKPVPGNHEYITANASGYYTYFGAAAGDPTQGYYSYAVGTWHIVALNSNCSQVGGCGAGSPQEQWLRSDLAAHPTKCTVAYWHHPRFSSGATHGSSTATQALWQALYDYNADIILAGHEHNYERFAPQDATGRADALRGIRQFVVGTGGKSHYGFGTILPTSQVRNADTSGVLKLTLHPTSFDFEFVPEAGKTFVDRGSNIGCH